MEDNYEYLPEGYPMPPPAMPGQRSDEVYSAVIQEKRTENILEQINPERLIIEIEFRLKGYKKNQFTKKWELIGKREKEVNDELISDILSILSANLTNNTTLSNFQPDEINKIMASLIRGLIDIIREKSSIYNLGDNYAERDRILLISLSTVFYSLKRAQGGLESKRVFESTQIREQPFNPQQNKSFLGKLLNL
ncbi:MAG: hypothetical protein WD512_15405 [Candidatus Paceibacterota bacterium]